jgi:hypothetical protein
MKSLPGTGNGLLEVRLTNKEFRHGEPTVVSYLKYFRDRNHQEQKV